MSLNEKLQLALWGYLACSVGILVCQVFILRENIKKQKEKKK